MFLFFLFSSHRLSKMSKRKREFDSYDALRKKSIAASDILSWHLKTVLESVFRRLTTREKFKEPWKITVKVGVFEGVFLEFYKAVRDHQSDFGKKTETIKTKAGATKSFLITFIHLGAFCRHLELVLIGKSLSIRSHLERSWESGATAKIICCEEKPITIEYIVAKSEMVVTLSFEVNNRYGVKCSY